MATRPKNSAYDSKDHENPSQPTNFVNHNYDRWLQIRLQWNTGAGAYSTNPSESIRGYNPHYQSQINRRRATAANGGPIHPTVNVDDIIDRLFSSSGNMTLPEPMPLEQMIEILNEVWEQEGA